MLLCDFSQADKEFYVYANGRRKHLSLYNRARAIYRALIMSYDSLPVMQLSLHATACVRLLFVDIKSNIRLLLFRYVANEAHNMNNVQLRTLKSN